MASKISQIDLKVLDPRKELIGLGEHAGDIHEGLLLCQVRTEDGCVGTAGLTTYTEYTIDRSILHAAATTLPAVVGMEAADRDGVAERLGKTYSFLRRQTMSLVDIALWDIAAKKAGVPLYQYLGPVRSSIEAYASIQSYPSIDGYIAALAALVDSPYRAVKIHPFCTVDKDVELISVLAIEFGNRFRFLFDSEQQYSRKEAEIVGRELDRWPQYEFFEAPINDFDISGYVALRDRLKIPLVMSGIELFSPELLAHVLSMGACDRLRFDTTLTGGITAALKLAGMAERAGIGVEVQSWGFTITQLANLHLMLAVQGATRFEQAIPAEPYDCGSAVSIRVDDSGEVRVPSRPGIGIEYSREFIEEHCIDGFTLEPSGCVVASAG